MLVTNGLSFIVTPQVAVVAPFDVETVTVAVPAAIAVISPDVETLATDVLLDDQVTDLSVALSGVTVAVNVCVSPTVIVSDVLSRLTLSTGMTFALTVTTHVAFLPPSFVVTVIVAIPTDFAVTASKDDDTVATDVSLDDQVTDLSEAFDGVTVAINEYVSPSVKVSEVGIKDTDSTATYFPFFPSCVTAISADSLLALMTIFPSRL